MQALGRKKKGKKPRNEIELLKFIRILSSYLSNFHNQATTKSKSMKFIYFLSHLGLILKKLLVIIKLMTHSLLWFLVNDSSETI